MPILWATSPIVMVCIWPLFPLDLKRASTVRLSVSQGSRGPNMFRNMKWLLIGLLIVSTVFYVVGVTLERNTESAESAASVKQESLAEGHDESAESHAEA